ncbi:hypothetical protein niasHT_005779 [Heterodera trifolii]|uniref:Uncharacterized protein n=1 Tax=Heterodera trifolii TaxID=157864 RepID=A0ABD2LTT2_9BILA
MHFGTVLSLPLPLFLVVCFSPAAFIAHFSANAEQQNAIEWNAKRDRICEMPLNVGNCTEKLTRFYYNSSKQRCFRFFYTGCNGNSNRFRTRNHCKRKCHPDFRVSAVFQSERKKAENDRQRNNCAENCRRAGGVCVNGICQCKSGYEKREGKCIDSNECDWISCERNAKCVNLPGSFRCECRKGFAGSGFNCTKNRRICAQPFDVRYERQCQPGQLWVPRFHFDLASAQCRHFWYGGCQFGSSHNFFQDKKNCESICGGYSRAEYFNEIAHNAPQNMVQQQKKSHDPCFDPFDESLRQHCAEGIWKRRYYFDAAVGYCRVFWMDISCPTPRAGGIRTRNIFVHVQNCRRACEREREGSRDEAALHQGELWRWREWEEAWGINGNRTAGFIQASFAKSTPTTTASSTAAPPTTTATASALLVQMPQLAEECAFVRLTDHLALAKTAQERRQRMQRLKAKLVKGRRKEEEQWKQQKVNNIGSQKYGQSEVCLDQFDWNLTKSCGRMRWRTHFFYDARSGKCRPFWNDGCTGQTRNNFGEAETCRRKCELNGVEKHWGERQRTAGLGTAQEIRAAVEGANENFLKKVPMKLQISETPPLMASLAICAQPFDDIYRRACNNGKSWTRKWYFDAMGGFCRHFWYDGCVGKTRNIFEGLKQCMDTCVKENDFLRLDQSKRMENQSKFAYFESAQATILRPPKNYLKSAEIWLNEKQCAGFRYELTGNALLSAFLCLLEEGGGCQRTVHRATNGGEKCYFGRSWLKGRHSYAWFFTLEKGPSPSETAEDDSSSSLALKEGSPPTTTTTTAISSVHPSSSTDSAYSSASVSLGPVERRRNVQTASAVLTLRQANGTDSLVVPIELFGRHNETVATVALFVAPIDQCTADTKC